MNIYKVPAFDDKKFNDPQPEKLGKASNNTALNVLIPSSQI